MVQDSNGIVLIGNGSGITSYNGLSWENTHVPNASHVLSLLVSKDNVVYYGSEKEFGYISSDSLNRLLPISLIDKIKGQVPLGDIWFIHELENSIYFQVQEGGLLRWNGNQIDHFDFGMPISSSFSVGSSIIFFSKKNGLFAFDGATLTTLSKESMFLKEEEFVFAVLPYRDSLLVGLRGEGLMIYKNNELIPFSTKLNSLISNGRNVVGAKYITDENFAIYTLDMGIVLVDSEKSFNQISKNSKYDEALSLSTNTIYKVKSDQEASLWLLHNEGLSWIDTFNPLLIYEKEEFQNKEIEFVSPVPEAEISNRLEEKWDLKIEMLGYIDGILFAGTEIGLFEVSKDSQQVKRSPMFADDDLINKQVFRFHQDKQGDVWFRTNRQIKFFKKIGSGSYEKVEHTIGTIGDGKEIFNITSKDSSVWFEGYDRVYQLDKSRLVEYDNTFKTNITGIYANRDSLIYGGFGEPVKPIVLPYKDNELRFNYAGASYIDPERNTYSYKLEGFDTDWSEWSLETQKDYTNIPEGEYIFNVRSRNVYEVDGTTDQITLTILPPWYRTWWAYMLYIISFSGLLYTGYKVRVNQLLKVERMRTKIASDLHDEVSATLTGISYFAEAIKMNKSKSKTDHFISLISESAEDAKEKITDIVWSINPENDDWELFLSKCRRFASDLLESKNLEYTLNITEFIPGRLDMEVRQHLWMIYKEIITNATRHSDAVRLDVILDVEDGVLKLIVQDNGEGFDVNTVQSGNGIRNIQNRAEKIGAKLSLTSEKEFGTRWRIELPL